MEQSSYGEGSYFLGKQGSRGGWLMVFVAWVREGSGEGGEAATPGLIQEIRVRRTGVVVNDD